jgi:hypothetical protein
MKTPVNPPPPTIPRPAAEQIHSDPKPDRVAAIFIALIGAIAAICVAYITASPLVQSRVKKEIRPYVQQIERLSQLTNLPPQVETLKQQLNDTQKTLQQNQATLAELGHLGTNHQTSLDGLKKFQTTAQQFMNDQKRIEVGRALKAGESVEIRFSQPFLRPPIVVITPSFRNAVKNVDTITSVSETGFTINSANGERDFFIYYLAMEK